MKEKQIVTVIIEYFTFKGIALVSAEHTLKKCATNKIVGIILMVKSNSSLAAKKLTNNFTEELILSEFISDGNLLADNFFTVKFFDFFFKNLNRILL